MKNSELIGLLEVEDEDGLVFIAGKETSKIIVEK